MLHRSQKVNIFYLLLKNTAVIDSLSLYELVGSSLSYES